MSYPPPHPQFSNPWASTAPASTSSHLYPSPLANNNVGFDAIAKQQMTRNSATPMAYTSAPVSAPSIAASNGYSSSPYDSQSMLGLSQNLVNHPRPTSSVSEANSHNSYNDALDAGRNMVAMSQDLTTPRNIYGPRSDRASSAESYGFPSTHSTSSSISSASTYPSYYGSMDSSVSEYSSQSSDIESVSSRTLPRPSGLVSANLPPAPQSMMGQFNSKLSSSTQKKHKCKVCDKRFTRPSSLQTHMYSHTGEKPYACEVSGCGRHFSVVSNLRRHRKVHKGERSPEADSPEGSWTKGD
ncbi:MAG: hypothetical protein Q9202_001275 [Teloschistes flavicans]